MVVAHLRESVNCCDSTFESLCHFSKSQEKAYHARLHHITPSVSNQQRERSPIQTHILSSRTVPRPQHVVNRELMSIVNVLENNIVEEQEDVYTQEVMSIAVPLLKPLKRSR